MQTEEIKEEPKRRGKLEPGIYDLPFDVYASIDAMSSSGLNLFRRSPAHYKAKINSTENRDTPALRFGRAQHLILLQPELFDSQFEILGAGKKRSKFAAKDTLTAKEGQALFAMRDAFNAHPYAKHFVEFSTRELSLIWHHPVKLQMEDGIIVDWDVLCKGRLDAIVSINGVKSIVDLKTTTDARPASFQRSIFKFGYHRQGAMYVDGARHLGLDVKHFVIIAIEKEPPYGMGLYRVMDEALEIGRQENNSFLQVVAKCQREDNWPCYETEVMDIGLPHWALSMSGFEDEE